MNAASPEPGKRILVVDDDKSICEVISLVLARAGYSVVAAGSPQQAIAAMRVDQCPVMFIDFHLPEMNGVDLCKIIKSEHPCSIAYLLTGYAPDNVLSECRAAGFKGFLIKPVNLKVLCAVIDAAFAGESTGGIDACSRHPDPILRALR